MNKKYLLAVAACTLMFTACGDDVTEVNEIHQDGMAVLEAGEKLSKQACDTTNVGEMLFVTDSAMVFVCDGKSWQTLKGEKGEDGGKGDPGKDGDNGTGCTSKSVKNKSGLEGLEVTCGETVIDTIWNGKDGQNGDDGTNCTAKSVKNKAGLEGLEVTCGETVIDTIWNGKDGQNGNNGTSCTATVNQDGGFDLVCDGQTVGTITNGEDGVGCTLDDEGDGKVTVSCGKGSAMTTTILYKAVCGTKPYDPLKSFCSEGKLYDLCGGKSYDPKKQFCKQGSTVEDYGWLKDTRDNQVYKTVKIGDQTWMAENLNYSVNPGTQSWCGGGESGTTNEGDCSVYGRLYTWAAAVGKSEDECGYEKTCNLPSGDIRGVCPEGWHLPSKDEWNALITAVSAEVAGKNLKADSDLWNYYKGISNDDSYGFSALPAGDRDYNGNFVGAGYYAFFWSASQDEYDSDYACHMDLGFGSEGVDMGYGNKNFGFSVRCLQNN